MLSMSVESVLARGRAAAERLMVDRCVIRRRTGETTDDDGHVTPTWETVYDATPPSAEGTGGKCRLKQPMAQPRPDDQGEADLLMVRRELQLPISVVGVQADDVALMTFSRHDPDVAGREFVVRGVHHATHATKRRLQVEEATS